MKKKQLKKELKEALEEVDTLTKHLNELAQAFKEIYGSLIESGLPMIASSIAHNLYERLDKEASGE